MSDDLEYDDDDPIFREVLSHCPHCKQKIRKMNPHRMCKNKVRMLEFLAKANDWVFVEAGRGAVVEGQVTKAPYRAQAHCSVLTWFGLAEHGERRSGMYRITDAGVNFLLNQHLVPKVIWSRDGKVVERDTMLVGIESVRGVVLDKEYWDNYPLVQRYPAEGSNPVEIAVEV